MTTTTTSATTAAAESLAWAERGIFNPGMEVPTIEAQARTRALLEDAGLDVDALRERVGRGRPRLDPQDDTVPVTFRATRRLYNQAQAQADTEGRAWAELMRDALCEYLNTHTPIAA